MKQLRDEEVFCASKEIDTRIVFGEERLRGVAGDRAQGPCLAGQTLPASQQVTKHLREKEE